MVARVTLTIAIFILSIAVNHVAVAGHILWGEWKTTDVSHDYPLKITEREITWPGCAPAVYTTKTMQVDDGFWMHIPHMKCANIPKDSGLGYLMVLREHLYYSWEPKNTYMLRAEIYDYADSGKEGWGMRDLAHGSFERIPPDGEKNYWGKIDNIPVEMRLILAKNGSVSGYYFYDKYRLEIAISGEIKGEFLALTVQDNLGNISEKFSGTYKDDGNELDGTWQSKGKSLSFHFARDILEDHFITCKEMKKYPEQVFTQRDIDLGSGHGSPTDVDYQCDGGLASLPFLDTIKLLTETIRAETVGDSSCTGSIVHAHWRYFHFSLLKAGIAPNISLEQKEKANPETESKETNQFQKAYFCWWANQSLGNFEIHQDFWQEHNRVIPILARHYQDTFKVSAEKASQYVESALTLFLNRATLNFPSALADNLKLSPLQKVLVEPTCTAEQLTSYLIGNISQDELDQGLKTALLHKKPQDVITILLDKGAQINIGDESALFFALRNHDTVRFLLKKGADVNYENGFGKTPLFYAIGFNDLSLVQLLLEHNADVNHPYKSKVVLDMKEGLVWRDFCSLHHTMRTPLMHAAQHANQDMLKLLLQHGAKLDSVDELGFNASGYATMGKKPENLAYLESVGLHKATNEK